MTDNNGITGNNRHSLQTNASRSLALVKPTVSITINYPASIVATPEKIGKTIFTPVNLCFHDSNPVNISSTN